MLEPTEPADETSQPAIHPDTLADLKAMSNTLRASEQEAGSNTREYRDLVTEPELRRYGPEEEFCFLVHAPLDIDGRTKQLGTEPFTQTERPLNTTLIDQDHTWTFEGMSGLIIEPPESDNEVLGAWSYDSGINDMMREPSQATPSEILKDTKPDNYNQVNVESGRVSGVYIRVREDGSEIGDEQRARELRQFAAQHNLPVAEIVVAPQRFEDSEPVIVNPTEDLTTIEFTADAKKFRVDALEADSERPLAGDIPFEGYYTRARAIDEYGEANGDVRDTQSQALIVDMLRSVLQTDVSERTKKILETLILRYTSVSEA